ISAYHPSSLHAALPIYIALLAEQKNASLVIQRIGAQELSRVGVSDAAAAVSKMSGISKEEGSTQVYIRGLGDRYVTTSFNGLPRSEEHTSELQSRENLV